MSEPESDERVRPLLVAALERADRLLAYSSEAAALLAHDLNNGLAVALGNVSYLARTAKLTSEQQDAVSATVLSLRRMTSLVNNFVDIARLEDMAIHPRSASAYNILDQSADDIRFFR